jgi:hypothetical protein
MTTGPFTAIEGKAQPDPLAVVQDDLLLLAARVRKLESAKPSICQRLCTTASVGFFAALSWAFKKEFT